MTVRADVTINWATSPRILTVLSPSVEITIQDLLDTCRELEDDMTNLQYATLASAAGKENLGGGVKVGITLTLLNAVLAFEARPGPTYVQCRVSGGNLVAVDGVGADISPIYPTAFTQVVTTASSSATIQEQADIQYASFGGAVHLNLSSSYSGSTFPVGTPRQPVNNFADAIAIANERGFTEFNIIGNAAIDSGLNYNGINFVGESQTKSTLIIDPAASVLNCEFNDASISGTLDGGSHIKNCLITNLNYVDGFIEDCVLAGTIVLGGDAHILNCWSGIPGASTPIIDFNNVAAALSLRNYNGGITLKNKTMDGYVSIDCNSGQIILDSTVTAGSILIRGIGKLTDNSAGATIDATHLIRPSMIATSVLDEPKTNHTTPGTIGNDMATKKDIISTAIVFGK